MRRVALGDRHYDGTPWATSYWRRVGQSVCGLRRNSYLDSGDDVERATIETPVPRRGAHRLIRYHENITASGSDYSVRNASEQRASWPTAAAGTQDERVRIQTTNDLLDSRCRCCIVDNEQLIAREVVAHLHQQSAQHGPRFIAPDFRSTSIPYLLRFPLTPTFRHRGLVRGTSAARTPSSRTIASATRTAPTDALVRSRARTMFRYAPQGMRSTIKPAAHATLHRVQKVGPGD